MALASDRRINPAGIYTPVVATAACNEELLSCASIDRAVTAVVSARPHVSRPVLITTLPRWAPTTLRAEEIEGDHSMNRRYGYRICAV